MKKCDSVLPRKGWIHSIESLAAVDGDGVRCAVFLSGCPLRCVYCHNPDAWSLRSGKEMTAEELVKKLVRFRPYFGENGGVTFSGGEPLLQADFLSRCIQILREEGISYVLDTSGAVALTSSVRAVLKGASQILLDLKFWDDPSYLRFTGSSWNPVWHTLRYLEEMNGRVTIRTVVIPGINDSREVLSRYVELLRGYSCIRKYELLPFHTLGFFKYESLGIENPLAKTSPLADRECSELQRFVDESLFRSTVSL